MCLDSVYNRENGTCCLIGWIGKYAAKNNKCPYGFYDVVLSSDLAAELMSELKFVIGDESDHVSLYNDTHTLEHNAKAWNTAMHNLGYDIDPEKRF
jgi:hypothetical protein